MTKNNRICRRIIGVNLWDVGLGSDFLDMRPKAQATKENNSNLGFIKIENFCATSDIIRKVKRQLTEWEKIFANPISDKRLTFWIYKEFLQINNKRKNNPIFLKGQSISIDIFPKKIYKWPKSTGKGSQYH